MAKIPTTRKSTPRTAYSSIAAGMYPARLTRFVGLGVQEQPEWDGQKKDPAFKVALTFELYNPSDLTPLDVTGVTPEGETVNRPSCVFQDYFLFPGAERGKVFELCQALEPGLKRVPDDMSWFIERLGAPLQVTVGTYPKKDGTTGAKVTNVTGVAPFISNQLQPARTDIVGFDPYEEAEKMELAYSKLYPFQRTILTEAHDSQYIPLAGTEPKKFEKDEPSAQSQQAPAQQAAPAAPAQPSIPEVGGDSFDDIPF